MEITSVYKLKKKSDDWYCQCLLKFVIFLLMGKSKLKWQRRLFSEFKFIRIYKNCWKCWPMLLVADQTGNVLVSMSFSKWHLKRKWFYYFHHVSRCRISWCCEYQCCLQDLFILKIFSNICHPSRFIFD